MQRGKVQDNRVRLGFALCTLYFALCGSACSNPLFQRDTDYGQRTSRERLRGIERLDRNKYVLPAPEAPPPPVVGDKYTSRFAGVDTASMSLEDARAAVLENNLDLRV